MISGSLTDAEVAVLLAVDELLGVGLEVDVAAAVDEGSASPGVSAAFEHPVAMASAAMMSAPAGAHRQRWWIFNVSSW